MPVTPDESAGQKDARRERHRHLALALLCTLGGLACAQVVLFSRKPWSGGSNAERYAYTSLRDGKLPRLWQLPEFSFIDQRHNTISRDSLRGKPFIADFIFTQCTNACPMMTSRMVQLQRGLAGRDLRFVSFSVDPTHDDVEALANYARRWNATESRWSLLATDESKLLEIVTAFRVTAEKTNESDNPIIHSNVFFLVDEESFVRGVYASDDDVAVDRLVSDVGRIAGAISPEGRTRASRPAGTYASLGCAGCHENPKVAPPLVNLRGAERTLEGGGRVVIDEAYLRRSLLEPGRELVKGYLPLMPSYRAELKDTDVDALVREIIERTSETAATPRAVDLVTDPVCHMQVRAEPDAPHITYQGHNVYFCSEACRDEFNASPARYPFAAGQHQ